MRDAIAWSYDLLSPRRAGPLPAPGRLRRRLHPGRGGRRRRRAAPSPGAGAGRRSPPWSTPACSRRRRDRTTSRATSCWRRSASSALEQVAANGEGEALARRHARYFLALAQAGATALANEGPGDWLVRLEPEQGNLRAALTWLRDHGESEAGLALAAALGGFWHVRSANAEGAGLARDVPGAGGRRGRRPPTASRRCAGRGSWPACRATCRPRRRIWQKPGPGPRDGRQARRRGRAACAGVGGAPARRRRRQPRALRPRPPR